MRPLSDFVESCTSLTEEQYCLRHPYPMLVHSVLSGELNPPAKKIVVGAASLCDLQLGDQSVSREHAIFSRSDNDYYIADNNSSAGTQVNDEVLMPAERRKLAVGDRVTLGLVDMNFLPAGAFYRFVRRLCAT